VKRLAIVLMFAAACGKGGDKGGGGGGKSGGGTADAKAANDAIPASWKGKVTFEVRSLGGEKKQSDEKVSVPVPKTWKAGFLEGSVEPADGDSAFGFGTKMWVTGGCDGECKARSSKEWEASANHSLFDNVLAHKPAPKIIKDEKKDGRRTMIAEDQYTDGNVNNTEVMTAWWTDGGTRFYFCDATLAPESKDLAPAFEKACLAAVEQ
jgi:hypothetical protein